MSRSKSEFLQNIVRFPHVKRRLPAQLKPMDHDLNSSKRGGLDCEIVKCEVIHSAHCEM